MLKFKVNVASRKRAEKLVKAKLKGIYFTGALMESATTTIIPAAAENAPVDSGALMDSIMVEPNESKTTTRKTTVKVGHDMRMKREWFGETRIPVTYAEEIEILGEKAPNPRPYMRPALDESKSAFIAALAVSIRRRLKEKTFHPF